MVENRMRRLFGAEGRTVILAMDHAAYFGPVRGLEKPDEIIQAAVRAGVDAVLTTYGIVSRFAGRFGRLGIILRADGGSTRLGSGGMRHIFTAEDALRIGADAVACMGFIGGADESDSLHALAGLVTQCCAWGLPVMAEMLVQKPERAPLTADDIAIAARVAGELGASVVKTHYVGPPDAFRQVTGQCCPPVVVLGGEKAPDARALLADVKGALEAGAAGVAIGRNVWQHENPEGMARALVALVHGGAAVDEAAEELTR
jgi:class I fructose-bisphosphate aldolase